VGIVILISKTPGTDVADVMLRQHVGSNLEAEVNGVYLNIAHNCADNNWHHFVFQPATS
jgi:hypothetical protein